jgi:imidazoleglycerol-phosphate dehydratase
MTQRKAEIERKTNETEIELSLNLDGSGQSENSTGVGFFDHMLDHVARHGLFDLKVRAEGDLHVDTHHTVEDVGICLGQALEKALGDKSGIVRFGSAQVPMEDALAQVSVDLCGRAYCVYQAAYGTQKIGEFDVELVEEFMRSFSNNARMNLHVKVEYGTNSHHVAEAIFKALGRALAQAVGYDDRVKGVPSTKGVL